MKTNILPVTSFTTPGGSVNVKSSTGSSFITGFETDTTPTSIQGIDRVISPSAFLQLQHQCSKHNIPWHSNAFAKSGYMNAQPHLDISLLSSLCRAIGNDVAQIITWFRGQTISDNRPNKHLRPDLYRLHLQGYPQLDALCLSANDLNVVLRYKRNYLRRPCWAKH